MNEHNDFEKTTDNQRASGKAHLSPREGWIRELAVLSSRRGMIMYSDFLTLPEQNLVRMLPLNNLGVRTVLYGGYETAERKAAAFVPSDSWEEPVSPLCCLLIRPKSEKYSEDLGHRDILGAVLNLGIERSVTGDILVGDGCWYLFCLSRISSFIVDNLTRIRHTSVTACPVSDPGSIPDPRYEMKSGTVASVRLDSLIHLAFGESRSSLVSLVTGGQVFVNGLEIRSPGYELKPGDIISVRRKGRFLYDGVSGNTKKDRLSVSVRLCV